MIPKMKKITRDLSVIRIFSITIIIVPKEASEDKNFTLESFSQIVFHTMSLITLSFSFGT